MQAISHILVRSLFNGNHRRVVFQVGHPEFVGLRHVILELLKGLYLLNLFLEHGQLHTRRDIQARQFGVHVHAGEELFGTGRGREHFGFGVRIERYDRGQRFVGEYVKRSIGNFPLFGSTVGIIRFTLQSCLRQGDACRCRGSVGDSRSFARVGLRTGGQGQDAHRDPSKCKFSSHEICRLV